MSVKPENIKLLREKTGAGMMDCKSALNETDGDLERAEEWLRKKGINTAQKKSAREASEGLITVSIKDSCGVIIEINSETDFVARNENFQKFCLDITNLCLIKKIDDKESLLKADFSDSGKTVEDELTNVISKLGENIVIKKSTEKLHLFKHHNTGNLSKFNFTNLFKSSIFIKSNRSFVICSNFQPNSIFFKLLKKL